MWKIITLACSLLITDYLLTAQNLEYLLNPFSLEIDPMERLLLINFENDPDSVYIGFEPQIFNDIVNGTGQLVIGWRKDGRIDVYHDAGLHPDPKKFDIAGKGLAHLVECNLNGGYYRVDSAGVQTFYAFKDLYNREIEVSIRERNQRTRKPFGLLAPMGLAAESPSAMPLIYLHDFYFVRRKHTAMSIKVNGRSHQADKLPLRIDGTKMYFTRYSPEPLILMFNPTHNNVLEKISVQPAVDTVELKSNTLILQRGKNGNSIMKIIQKNEVHPVAITFSPAFPDLINMPVYDRIEGQFVLESHPSTGIVGGTYMVARDADYAIIKLQPSAGWKPRPSKFSLRFLYTVAKDFKRWPKTYEWNAKIRLTEIDDKGYHMESSWIRIK